MASDLFTFRILKMLFGEQIMVGTRVSNKWIVNQKWVAKVGAGIVGCVLAFHAITAHAQNAQNGQTIQGFFRTMAEARAERDRQDALAQQNARGIRVEPVPRINAGFGQTVTPAQPTLFPPNPQPNAQPRTQPNAGITILNPGENQNASWFPNSLSVFRDDINRLIPELQSAARTTPLLRDLIADAYQVSAEADSLYNRTRSGEQLNSVFAAYQQVDVRWRDVSYRLRATNSLDSRITSLLDSIDASTRTIDQRLGIAPPIDRVRLRDMMIVTLTFMDALFDDIRLAPLAFNQSDALLRDGRILRERLRQESSKIDRGDYNDVVASFTEFVQLWRAYGARLYQLNDAHVNQRLDSIRRQGEDVYASLRIPAATDRRQVQFAGQRLTASLLTLQDQLVRWGTNRLPADQLRFTDTVRVLVNRSRQFETELTRGSASSSAVAILTEMDGTWTAGLRSMRAVDPASGLQLSLAQVDALFTEMKDLLQVGNFQGQENLLNVAASLEATSDDFNIDVQRYKRYLTPTQYRDSLAEISDDMFAASRDLHRLLDNRGDSREAARLTQRIVERWQQLTPLLNELTQHGLTQSRAEQVFEGYRQIQPLLAQAASALLN